MKLPRIIFSLQTVLRYRRRDGDSINCYLLSLLDCLDGFGVRTPRDEQIISIYLRANAGIVSSIRFMKDGTPFLWNTQFISELILIVREFYLLSGNICRNYGWTA